MWQFFLYPSVLLIATALNMYNDTAVNDIASALSQQAVDLKELLSIAKKVGLPCWNSSWIKKQKLYN